MPFVKPMSDLRNRTKKISQMVHRQDEPVIITKNGEGDMVVMSYDHFTNLTTRLELYEKLSVAEAEDVQGAPTYDLEEVVRRVKRSLGV